MKRNRFWLSASGLALALLLGACGGGAGSGSGGTVTVNFVDALGNPWAPPKVATQVGTGTWQSAPSGTSVTLNLPSGVAQYGVAFTCGTETQVVQFTKGEAPNPTLRCSSANAPASVNVTLNYNDSAFPTTANRLYTVNTLNVAFGALTSNPATLTVSPGQGDLLVALYNNSWAVIALKGLLNQNFTAGANFSLNFAASDATSGTGNTGSYSVPSGFTTGGTAVFHVTPLGAYAILNNDFSAPGNALAFPLPPSALLGQKVVYANAFSSGLSVLSVEAFTGTSHTPTLPPVFNPTVSTSAKFPAFSGLSASGSDFIGYSFSANWSGKNLTAIVSKGWIGTGTSYALPDLSSLGFPVPAAGDTVSYQASTFYSNKPLGTLLAAPNFWKLLATSGIYLRSGSEEGSYTAP
jgi:hypothetical protein